MDIINKESFEDAIRIGNIPMNGIASILMKIMKIDQINELYDKMYRLDMIDTDECIMLKPPQLKRSDNNVNSNKVNIFDITILEHMISRLERKLTDVEKIEIYQNRLDKLEECLIQKHTRNLYKEN